MTTIKVVVEIELPADIMDLLERLVWVLESEYDQRYGEHDDADED